MPSLGSSPFSGQSPSDATVADLRIEVCTPDGEAIRETIDYRVIVSGNDGDDFDVLGVSCRSAILTGHPAHIPAGLESASLVREFYAMLANDGGLYDGEHDSIVAQIDKALRDDSPEALRSAAEHQRAESLYGNSL